MLGVCYVGFVAETINNKQGDDMTSNDTKRLRILQRNGITAGTLFGELYAELSDESNVNITKMTAKDFNALVEIEGE